MLHNVHSVDDPGIVAQLPAPDDVRGRHRKIPDLSGRGGAYRVQIKGHRQPVVMTGGEMKVSGVVPAKIQLHIPGACVGHGIGPGGVFHSPLPAVVYGKQRSAGHIGAFVVRYVKVVEAEHNAGKHIVNGHGPVAALVSELPNGAAVILRQQPCALFVRRAAGEKRPILLHGFCLLSAVIVWIARSR